MRSWRPVLLALTLALGCGPDDRPGTCHGSPDFVVIITAAYGPVPSDTIIRLHYGGRAFDDPEELDLSDPGTPQALFCYAADRDGRKLSQVALGNSRSDAAGGAAGAAGAAGDGNESAAPIEALRCELWTDGSADLDVVTETYGTTSVKLETTRGLCTVQENVELMPADGGM